MGSSEKPLEELVRELPPAVQAEVRDFVEFLIAKHKTSSGKRLKQNWAGGLSAFKKEYTSVELQHKASEWP